MTLVPPTSHGGGGTGTVTSVTATDGSIVVTGTATDPTIATGTLDAIATAHPPAAAVAMNAKKITGIAVATVSTDAASLANTLDQFGAPAANVAFNAKKITGLAVATVSTDAASLANTLDQFGAPAANVAFNAKKITGLANGSAATDALAVGQVLAAGAIPIADIADPGAGKVIGSSSGAAAVTPPGFEIGYDQITANVTVSSTTEATGTAVISCAAHTFDGALVLAEFFTPAITPASAATAFVIVSLFEGATQIGRLVVVEQGLIGTANSAAQVGKLRFTPSAGSHTYTVTAFQINGNGTIVAGAGSTGAAVAAYMRFTKV